MFWKRKKPATEAAGLEEPRRHHYEFAHLALRQICAEDPARFFAIVASDERQRFLEWIWKSVEEHAGAPASGGMSVADLDVRTGRLGGFPAILVGMPPPRATAEAHAVALVLTGMGEQPPAGDEKPAFRYFTLEAGRQPDGSPRTVLCEWAEGSHLNFGDGPAADLQAFGQTIEAKLARN